MKDFIITENDLSFENGDLAVEKSEAQSLEFLLISEQGEWKENPSLGAGIAKQVSGLATLNLERTIRVQCEADGFAIKQLNLGENLEIDGEYR